MSKKYFVTSDIHGFYDEFKNALDKARFNINDPEHILIICGDIFDRGKKPLEIYDFLKSLPKERRVLIRGNHEILLRDLVEKGYPERHDIHNGTYDTLAYISKQPARDYFRELLFKSGKADIDKILKKREAYEHKLFHNRKLKEILKWIASDEWVNYYELDKYIFVHSFIPLKSNVDSKEVYFGGLNATEEYNPDWRNATAYEWEEAMWGCPWKKVALNKTGKIIVCGHWHTSDFWNNLVYEDDYSKRLDLYKENPIFYKSGIPLIGLDACTAATKGVNIVVINEDDSLDLYSHTGDIKHENIK